MGIGKTLRSISIVGLKNFIRLKSEDYRKVLRVKIEDREIFLRARTTDLSVAIDSLTDEYEHLSGLLPSSFSGLIVDAGAYIGTASVRLSELYPMATIVAIEPSSLNFSVLKMNTERNKNIHLVKAALSTRSGEIVDLIDPGDREWGFKVSTESDPAVESGCIIEKVRTVTLLDIVEDYGDSIGILKLDIEGAEVALFELASDILSSIPIIIVELHERIVPGSLRSFENFSKNREVVEGKGEKFLSIARGQSRGGGRSR